MNSKTVTAAALCLFIGFVAANEAPAKPPTFDEVVADAKVKLDSIGKHVQTMFGLPEFNSNDTVAAVKSYADQLHSNITTFMNSLEEKAKEKNAFTDLIVKINQTATGLTTPEFQEKTKKLQETFSTSFNTIVEEVNKAYVEVNKEANHSGFNADTAKKTVEQIVAMAKSFESKVHNAIGDHAHQAHGDKH